LCARHFGSSPTFQGTTAIVKGFGVRRETGKE
jgi:hypothetical protein